jgi:hypothetical protein
MTKDRPQVWTEPRPTNAVWDPILVPPETQSESEIDKALRKLAENPNIASLRTITQPIEKPAAEVQVDAGPTNKQPALRSGTIVLVDGVKIDDTPGVRVIGKILNEKDGRYSVEFYDALTGEVEIASGIKSSKIKPVEAGESTEGFAAPTPTSDFADGLTVREVQDAYRAKMNQIRSKIHSTGIGADIIKMNKRTTPSLGTLLTKQDAFEPGKIVIVKVVSDALNGADHRLLGKVISENSGKYNLVVFDDTTGETQIASGVQASQIGPPDYDVFSDQSLQLKALDALNAAAQLAESRASSLEA